MLIRRNGIKTKTGYCLQGRHPVLFSGVPGEIRTPDLRLRRPTLYPAEPRAHSFLPHTPDIRTSGVCVAHSIRHPLLGQGRLRGRTKPSAARKTGSQALVQRPDPNDGSRGFPLASWSCSGRKAAGLKQAAQIHPCSVPGPGRSPSAWE